MFVPTSCQSCYIMITTKFKKTWRIVNSYKSFGTFRDANVDMVISHYNSHKFVMRSCIFTLLAPLSLYYLCVPSSANSLSLMCFVFLIDFIFSKKNYRSLFSGFACLKDELLRWWSVSKRGAVLCIDSLVLYSIFQRSITIQFSRSQKIFGF